MKIKLVDVLILLCCLVVFALAYQYEEGTRQFIFCGGSLFLVVVVIFSSLSGNSQTGGAEPTKQITTSKGITELALINEEERFIATWELYGKTSMVIGLDVGENHVDVNLMESAYASMIDVEHAVLNYVSGRWYIEDLGSENGVDIVKSDGKKYKLTAAKPCLVEKGDVIFISLTKLKLC